MTENTRSLVENFILVRLMDTKRKLAMTGNDIGKSLHKIFETHFPTSEWNRHFKNAMTLLLDMRMIREAPKKKKNHVSRYRLTDAGRLRGRRFLGADYFPEPVKWETLLNKYIVARSLGIRIRSELDLKRIGVKGFLPKAIVKQGLDLHPDVDPSDRYFWHAVYWSALGVRTTKRFNVKEVKRHLLNQTLEAEDPLGNSSAKIQLPAKLIHALNPSPDALREALLDRLVRGKATPGFPPHPDNDVENGGILPGENLEIFARRVMEAARESPTGRYGEDKVFISHVWRCFSKDGFGENMSEATFKSRLLEANRMDFLTLGRADLPDQLNPGDVESSATPYLNTVFHFIYV